MKMKDLKHEQIVKLETLKNMAYKIAEYNIRVNGVYYCVLNGKKTKVIR